MAELVHIMTDLETMGVIPGCAGLSIGCVVMDFNDFTLKEEFYTVISLPDSLENFLHEEDSTKEWWESKSPEARQVLVDANQPGAPRLADALIELNNWFRRIGAGVGNARLYGNGADFDNPILRVMYHAAKVLPFDSKKGFFGGRCYRTLKTMDDLFGPAFAAPPMNRQGVYHNALDDAKSQARHLMETVRAIRSAVTQAKWHG